MEVKMQEMLEKITDFIQDEAKTETIVGREFQLGEYTCVPVIRIGTGFGTAGGEGLGGRRARAEAGGAGAGIGIEPIGFLVTRNEAISFIPTMQSRGFAAAIEKAPDVIEKYFEEREKHEHAEA